MSRSNTDKPALNAEAVTKSDSTTYTPTSALYIGVGGNVAVTTEGGQVVTFENVLGGTWIPLQVTKVMSTNTTASSIIRVW